MDSAKPSAPIATRASSPGFFNMGTLSSVGSLAATGFSAVSSINAGRAMSAQYEIQSESYKLQAEAIKINAIERSNMLRKQLLENLGAARASAAARGIDVGSGSPMQAQVQSIGNVESDIARIKAGSAIESSNAMINSGKSTAQGAAEKASGYASAGRSLVTQGLRGI